MHVNFDAEIVSSNTLDLIYPVIKNNKSIKLGQIVVSKAKTEDNDKKVHITVPLFITEQLG